jgi:hypothetical protein
VFGDGSADVKKKTDLFSVFFNDDWRPSPNLTLSLGIRYDYDTQGNNPDFDDSPLVGPRSTDTNNIQPRVGFSWDINNDGKNILRGGAGIFTGRYLLVPAFSELQQNGTTGRVVQQNTDGFALCLIFGIPLEFCPFPPLNPADLENSGVPGQASATLLEDSLVAPETIQASMRRSMPRVTTRSWSATPTGAATTTRAASTRPGTRSTPTPTTAARSSLRPS